MVTVPHAKGWGGVTYRTQLGLHRSGSVAPGAAPDAPLWDVHIGPLPFLIAAREESPYQRESIPPRRDRMDTTRDAGEASLDSALWIRSWTSWHLGAGQRSAEPLETSPDVARFRFHRSAGVDVWTDGQVSLLPQLVDAGRTDVRFLTSIPSRGVVAACASGVRLITATTDQVIAPDVLTRITVNGSLWMGVRESDATVRWGDLLTTGATQGSIPGVTGATAVCWAKDRLWVGAGSRLYEVADLSASPAPLAHEFKTGRVVALAGSAGGMYVMVDDGQTRIFVITVEDDGSLSAPREVAMLPRGESGRLLYSYLSRFLLVGTSLGVRVADAAVPDSLPMGPLVIQIAGGPADATADGNFLWITAGTEGIDVAADGGDIHPGLYRMDLSRVVVAGVGYGDSAASRFAWATDVYAPIAGGLARSVTVHEGRVYLAAGGGLAGRLWVTSPDLLVGSGWLETGQVTFSTAEKKVWASLTATVGGVGRAGFYADTGSGWNPVTQTLLPSPFSGEAALDTRVHAASHGLDVQVWLTGDTHSGPVLTALGVRAAAAPKRTRYVHLPVLAFDHQADRNNTPVGYDGFAYDRIKDLEAMESAGAQITVTDERTGETMTGLIEKIDFQGRTPPDRGRGNWGGMATVSILVM